MGARRSAAMDPMFRLDAGPPCFLACSGPGALLLCLLLRLQAVAKIGGALL